ADAQPAYSPDGQWLAYVSQARAGFESDQWVLKALARANNASYELTKSLDRPVQSFSWDSKSTGLVAVIDDTGTEPIIAIRFDVMTDGPSVTVVAPNQFPRLITGGAQSGLQVSAKGGKLVFTRHDAASPAEVFTAGLDGSSLTQLTHHNAALL